jgi:hypothetical protein
MNADSADSMGRFARRYRKASLAWFHVLDPATAGDVQEGIGAGFDISRSGMGLNVSKAMPLGARVLVHVRCREFEFTAVMQVARVRLANPGQFEVGLHFLVVPPDYRSLMQRVFP